jgi:uncharacterized low-complexity protein
MNLVKRMSTGVLVSVFALGGLAGCASGDETTREEEEVAEQDLGEQWEEAGEETAEAAEETAEGAVGATKRGAQKAEAATKEVGQEGRVAAERAEKQVEEWVGGGPVESDTRRKIEEVEREMQNYRQGIEEQGYKLDEVTRLRMQQVEERAQLVKKQFNELVQEANWGVAEIDAELQSTAEDVKDDWEDIEDQLEVELGRSYENMDED